MDEELKYYKLNEDGLKQELMEEKLNLELIDDELI